MTVRSIIALAAAQKWNIQKMNVYNDFKQEDAYMELPHLMSQQQIVKQKVFANCLNHSMGLNKHLENVIPN